MARSTSVDHHKAASFEGKSFRGSPSPAEQLLSMQRYLGNKNTCKIVASAAVDNRVSVPQLMQRSLLSGSVKKSFTENASVQSVERKQAGIVKSGKTVGSTKGKKEASPDSRDLILQRKSKITSLNPKSVVKSPIEVLHDEVEDFFKKASLFERYQFHGLGSKQPSEYATNTYVRAGDVSAEIDPSSKADGSNRDNNVIAPYGHFGAMERSIFNRQDLGNTFDGGHLVEHTLMEGRDADVHGNIAPQENKHFNQGLMRGWESVPENLMQSQKFNYKVSVAYSGSNFTRTGEQLLKSGVLDSNLEKKLQISSPGDLATLKNKVITFPRWVPTTWQASVTPNSVGTKLPNTTISHMPSHLHNLKSTPKDAYDHVFHVPDLTKPHLTRRNSGTLSGAIWSVSGGTNTNLAALSGGAGYVLPASDEIKAIMYQPDAMDESEQPKATTTPSGGVPSVIPVSTAPVKILLSPFSVGALAKEVMAFSGTKNDANLKTHSPLYRRMRDEISIPVSGGIKKKHKSKKSSILNNADKGVALMAAIMKELSSATSLPFNKSRFFRAVAAAQLDKKTKQSLLLLENDTQMND